MDNTLQRALMSGWCDTSLRHHHEGVFRTAHARTHTTPRTHMPQTHTHTHFFRFYWAGEPVYDIWFHRFSFLWFKDDDFNQQQEQV
jgi:hypothetical protein